MELVIRLGIPFHFHRLFRVIDDYRGYDDSIPVFGARTRVISSSALSLARLLLVDATIERQSSQWMKLVLRSCRMRIFFIHCALIKWVLKRGKDLFSGISFRLARFFSRLSVVWMYRPVLDWDFGFYSHFRPNCALFSQGLMDEATKVEGHLSSAAAFVEGGIQEACDDSCSICLEPFSESDPSTVTGCKHEFHLQCILEWCQRSSQCPMCWQGIILKDPLSQELLEAVQQERSFNLNQSRNTAIFHHPALGDFELPLGSSDAELEERIIQHLAAAAAMGRARRMARREGQRRPATHHHPGQGHPQLFVFSTHSAGALAGEATSDSQNHCRNHDHNRAPAFSAAADSNNYDDNRGGAAPLSSGIPLRLGGQDESSSSQQQTVRTSLLEQDNNSMAPSTPPPANESGPSSNWYLARQSPAPENANQEGAGPPDLQSLSDSIKSRWNAVSLRCKDSITKTARGWRERFFARSSSVSSSSTLDLVSEERREVSTMITPNVPPMAEVPALREDSDRRSDPPLPMPAPPPTEDMAGILEHPEAAMTGQTGETCPSDGPVAAVSASSSSHR